MKSIKRIFSVALVLMGLGASAQNTLPAIEKYKLKNGLEVVFSDYGNLPATSMSFYVNTGKKNETPGQQFLAELTVNALQMGSEKYARLVQDDLLHELGGQFNVSTNDNYSKFTMTFPNEESERALDLLSAALLKPAFAESEVKQFVSEQLNYNNPSRMDIAGLTKMYGDFIVFGQAHPLGRHFYASQLNKITTAQVKEFYKFNYTPKNTRLVIAGKPDKEKMKKLIEEYFGSWTAEFGEVNGSAYEVAPINKQEFFFVNRPRATQAALRWYKKAPTAGAKDLVAFEITNYIFSNVLFDQIRGKEGKTYGISSTFSESNNNGTYNVSTQVRNEVMYATLQSFDNVIKDFYDKGMSADQLAQAKVTYKNSVLSMEHPSQMADFINPWLYNDYNKRKEYLNEIDKLDIATVSKIIKKYFSPDAYKLIIAGDESKLEQQLQQVKGLTRIPLKTIEVDN